MKVLSIRPKSSNLVPCGFCRGMPIVGRCPRCLGTGTRSRRGTIVVPKAPPSRWKDLGALDLQEAGFRKSGAVQEAYPDSYAGMLLREWYTTSDPHRKEHWEGQLALGGWVRRPLTKEELARKYPPPIREV